MKLPTDMLPCWKKLFAAIRNIGCGAIGGGNINEYKEEVIGIDFKI